MVFINVIGNPRLWMQWIYAHGVKGHTIPAPLLSAVFQIWHGSKILPIENNWLFIRYSSHSSSAVLRCGPQPVTSRSTNAFLAKRRAWNKVALALSNNPNIFTIVWTIDTNGKYICTCIIIPQWPLLFLPVRRKPCCVDRNVRNYDSQSTQRTSGTEVLIYTHEKRMGTQITLWLPRAVSPSYHYKESQYTDKMDWRQSYICNANHHIWKDRLYLETGPWWPGAKS